MTQFHDLGRARLTAHGGCDAELPIDPEALDRDYQLGEQLMKLDQQFSVYRWRHFVSVERIIGYKPGTGRSSRVAWLDAVTRHRFFPELWAIRT